MAWTKRELFSFAYRCEYFTLRLESGLAIKRSQVIFVLTNYKGPLDPARMIEGVKYSDSILNGNTFPASVLRKAFDYAQQRANELGADVRIVMEACAKEEYADEITKSYGEDEGLFAVATVKPSSIGREILSILPVVHCSHCAKPATQQFVKRDVEDEVSIVEYGCDEHIEDIHSHWK
jgi:hypothetical protein